MSFLIDTSVLIDVFMNQNKATKLRDYLREKEFFVSIITLYEIYKARKLDPRIEEFMRNCSIILIDFDSAKKAAEIFKQLQENGAMVNEMDIIIAATALSRNFTLLTEDTDFEKIEEIVPQFRAKIFK